MSGARKRETSIVQTGDNRTPAKTPAWAAKSTTTPKSGAPIKTPDFAIRPSLLSTEASRHSYKGFINLTVILLIITNFRLIVENILKYGWIVELEPFIVREWYKWPGLSISIGIGLFMTLTLAVEKIASKNLLSERTLSFVHLINVGLIVVLPSAGVLLYKPPAASGVMVMLFTTVAMMKVISYTQVNKEARLARNPKTKEGESKGLVQYPDNLTLSDLVYFIAAPTLVYDLNFPRVQAIRWGFLVRRILETIALSALIFGICEQYILPLIRNSIMPLDNADLLHITERLLKLSIPNLLVWLIGFYVFFHLYLNLLAEITRFGDREFYRDWWNSTDLGYFWRTWNMPVHHWILKHIYTPLIKAKYSQHTAKFCAFLVSALFHEFVISIPFAAFKMWAFLGILMQLPLITLTNKYCKGKNIGNVFFWFSIVLGQPFCVLMYYRDYVKRNYTI